MREQHIAGLSLGIARRGARLYLRGYGYREVERRLPADGFTVYRVGSVAKQFTAALVLQTVEEGRILLTTSIRAYLPQLDGSMQRVTAEHLLEQTSGVSGDWHYSNANYTLLGSMLEAVTGRRFPDLLRERITEPLALTSTGCDVAPFATNVARGYEWHGTWTPPEPDAELPCSSVGLAANAADLIRWLEALRSGRVVSAASFKAMTSSARLLQRNSNELRRRLLHRQLVRLRRRGAFGERRRILGRRCARSARRSGSRGSQQRGHGGSDAAGKEHRRRFGSTARPQSRGYPRRAAAEREPAHHVRPQSAAADIRLCVVRNP